MTTTEVTPRGDGSPRSCVSWRQVQRMLRPAGFFGSDTDITSVRRTLPWYVALPVAAVSGLLLDLAFPSIGWWPLAFVSVAGGLCTLVGRSVGGAFLTGLVYGAAFYFTHLIWVVQFLGPTPWVALAGLESLLFAIGAIPIALAYRWLGRSNPGGTRTILVPLLIAALWTTRELVLGIWPYGGFPWGRIGMSQANSPFAEAASWIGVPGLTFLIVCMCAILVQWVGARLFQTPARLFPALVIAALLSVPAYPTTVAGSFRVGWVQGDGPAGYFDDRRPGDVLTAQIEATKALSGEPLDLIVWPEGGVDSDPLANLATAQELDKIVQRAGAPLLMNAATKRGSDIFNTSMLWEADAAMQLHDKANPVPFGEYVPDRWFYEQIVPDLTNLVQREYTPGTNPPFVTVDGIGIGLAICFDVIYDTVIWDGAESGAQFYVFQTNNADFRGTDENLQQLEFARMRAIETGRAVVNVSTVGTSQVIAPDGKVIESAPADVPAASTTEVPLRTGLTAAVWVGPILTKLIPISATAALLVAGILRGRQRQTKSPHSNLTPTWNAHAGPRLTQGES